MESVLKFKQPEGHFNIPDGEQDEIYCEDIESAINSYYGINFCGCGNRESALRLIKNALAWCNKKEENNYENPFKWDLQEQNLAAWYFIMYQLEVWDLTEHGSSVGGSWLTEKGQLMLEDLIIMEKELQDLNND